MVKSLPAMQETRVQALDQEDPLEKEIAISFHTSFLPFPTILIPVLLPGRSHGQRSLVDYSPGGHKELDMTTRLTLCVFMP